MPEDQNPDRRRSPRLHGRVPREEGCAYPDCAERGEFRAPRPGARGGGFDGPAGWQWLCLDHVRAFNNRYNYFEGMSPDEIEAAQRPYAGWERETRAFSAEPRIGPRWGDFSDPLEAINAHLRPRTGPRGESKLLSERDHRLLKVLGLSPEADRRGLRMRYAELLRRYHPDHNGGDRSHEKALQDVIAAYTALKSRPAFA